MTMKRFRKGQFQTKACLYGTWSFNCKIRFYYGHFQMSIFLNRTWYVYYLRNSALETNVNASFARIHGAVTIKYGILSQRCFNDSSIWNTRVVIISIITLCSLSSSAELCYKSATKLSL